MSKMKFPIVQIVEPSSQQSKHRAAGIFVRKETRDDINSIKKRLKSIREYSRENNIILIEQLKNTLKRYDGLKITYAENAKEAASYIKKHADNNDLLSLNKSNVVINEIRPELKALGFKTYLRYFKEFNNFEKEKFKKQIIDYWSLPGMHERGLIESFGVNKKIEKITSYDMRDYIAVLGVNAISAEDANIFFLQHMSNISKDFEQARKIILIVSIEKIMKDTGDALLHTQSMGIFGLESILLDLSPNEKEIFDFDSLPVISHTASEKEIHVILFDNGRSKLLNNDFRDLLLCIDCRACARQCPVGMHLLLEKEMVYSPKNYLMGFLQGSLPTTEGCLHCGRCHVECPVDIDIPTLIWKAQLEYYARHSRGLKKRMLDDPEVLAKLGSTTAPISNWLTRIPIVKLLTELFAGVHHKANLPIFHKETFRDWFERRRHGR
ncbi:MAG: 4Fe-4S dicluster domain-containing protein [Syntrophorhabdaceae bacterium]|nr:4Fe-4S dicluster domain-containing protein [Syntrophorhabdaceae bacterium]